MVRTAAALPLLLLAAAHAPPARADLPEDGHALVVLAEPAVPVGSAVDRVAEPTLSWGVREIFAGDPGAASIAVRHRGLEASQLRALAGGERWILLADADPDRPGRWLASMPLRATPDAVAAFRKWSAPPDVRAPRPVAELVDELSQAAPEAEGAIVMAPANEPWAESVAPASVRPVTARPESLVPAPAVAPAPTAVESQGPVLVAAETARPAPLGESPVASVHGEPLAVTPPLPVTGGLVMPDEAPAAQAAAGSTGWAWPAAAPGGGDAAGPSRLEPPAPELVGSEPVVLDVVTWSAPSAPSAPASGSWSPAGPVPGPLAVDRLERPRSRSTAGAGEPPLTWRPALQPPVGPGLPPAPSEQPLGVAPAERRDLKKGARSRPGRGGGS